MLANEKLIADRRFRKWESSSRLSSNIRMKFHYWDDAAVKASCVPLLAVTTLWF